MYVVISPLFSFTGVGDYYDDQELMNIANGPSEEFVFLVENYNSLDKIKEILAIKTCTGGHIDFHLHNYLGM